MSTELLRVDVADGKYTVIQESDGSLYALRNGERWSAFVGNNFVLAMAQEIQSLREKLSLASAKEEIWYASSDGIYFGEGPHKSREEAIDAGKKRFSGEFYIGRAVDPTQPEEFFEAGDWLDHVSGQDEYQGDHAEGWDMSTEADKEKLNIAVRKVMADWLDENSLRPAFYNITDDEKIEPDKQP